MVLGMVNVTVQETASHGRRCVLTGGRRRHKKTGDPATRGEGARKDPVCFAWLTSALVVTGVGVRLNSVEVSEKLGLLRHAILSWYALGVVAMRHFHDALCRGERRGSDRYENERQNEENCNGPRGGQNGPAGPHFLLCER